MHETAYAKLNLALRVRGRRADGYHEIDTAFAFAEDGDRLSVAEGEGTQPRVVGPFAGDLGDAEDNLVLRAARLLGRRVAGAALTLDKRLPVASGIGGGSADAAAALRLLVALVGARPAPRTSSCELAAAARRRRARPASSRARSRRHGPRRRLDRRFGGFCRHAAAAGQSGRAAVDTAEVFGRWRGVTGPLGNRPRAVSAPRAARP